MGQLVHELPQAMVEAPIGWLRASHRDRRVRPTLRFPVDATIEAFSEILYDGKEVLDPARTPAPRDRRS